MFELKDKVHTVTQMVDDGGGQYPTSCGVLRNRLMWHCSLGSEVGSNVVLMVVESAVEHSSWIHFQTPSNLL